MEKVREGKANYLFLNKTINDIFYIRGLETRSYRFFRAKTILLNRSCSQVSKCDLKSRILYAVQKSLNGEPFKLNVH